jgi:hypothetical protein
MRNYWKPVRSAENVRHISFSRLGHIFTFTGLLIFSRFRLRHKGPRSALGWHKSLSKLLNQPVRALYNFQSNPQLASWCRWRSCLICPRYVNSHAKTPAASWRACGQETSRWGTQSIIEGTSVVSGPYVDVVSVRRIGRRPADSSGPIPYKFTLWLQCLENSRHLLHYIPIYETRHFIPYH